MAVRRDANPHAFRQRRHLDGFENAAIPSHFGLDEADNAAGNAQQIAREAGVGEVDWLIDPAPYQARVTINVSGLVLENALKGLSESNNTKKHPMQPMNHRSFAHHARSVALWALSIMLIQMVVVCEGDSEFRRK